MFTRIVVPLDGSRFAEAALAPAQELAKLFNARLLLVRAESPANLPVLAPVNTRIDLEDLNEADAYLHEMVNSLRATGQDADMLLYIAPPGAGISRAAELDHADLIVMATHVRWHQGVHTPSTTLAVLKRSRVPILSWHPSGTTNELGGPDRLDTDGHSAIFNRADCPIVVPLDGSAFAEGALPMVEALAQACGTYLVLVRAVHDAAQRDEAQTYLRRIGEQIASRGGHTVSSVQIGMPLSVIENAWREYNASLIVLASHGTHPSSGTYLGSVAAGLIEEVEAPILMMRPPVEVALGI